MPGSKKALLIATDSYCDPKFGQLHSPVADVDGLHAVLSDPAIGGYAAKPLHNEPEPAVTRELGPRPWRWCMRNHSRDLFLFKRISPQLSIPYHW